MMILRAMGLGLFQGTAGRVWTALSEVMDDDPDQPSRCCDSDCRWRSEAFTLPRNDSIAGAMMIIDGWGICD